MRFPIAALFFIIASFIFFVIFASCSLFINEIGNSAQFENAKNTLDSRFEQQINTIGTAFGVISAIFFVTGILLIFILDSLSDEPEFYYRR